MTANPSRSGVWKREGRENAEEGALSSTVGAQKAEEFSPANLEGNSIESPAFAERLHQIVCNDGVGLWIAHKG